MGVPNFLCFANVSCIQRNVSKGKGTASFQVCQSCGSVGPQKRAWLLADLLIERVRRGKQGGAEVSHLLFQRCPLKVKECPLVSERSFVAVQAKIPLLQSLEKLGRSYRICGCAERSSSLGTLIVLSPRLLLLSNNVLFLESISE